jgi:hypothetical protein
MVTDKTHEPIIVALGVLRRDEFARLSREDQREVEGMTWELSRRYDAAWFAREQARLRDELSFFYGI